MSNCGLRLIIKNQFAESTVAVSPAPLPGYPATNMLMTWRSRVMRTSGTRNQVITFVLPASEAADAFYCPVDGGCTLRLELFADAGMTARVYDSGITRFGVQVDQVIPWGKMEYGVHAWGETEMVLVGAARALYFDPVQYLAAKVTLDFESATSGWIEVPYLSIGQAWKSQYGASRGASLAIRTSRQKKRTRGGSLHRLGQAKQWRELSLSLEFLSEDERSDLHAQISQSNGEAVLIDMYPLSETKLHDQHLFLADVDPPEITHASAFHTTKLLFEEI